MPSKFCIIWEDDIKLKLNPKYWIKGEMIISFLGIISDRVGTWDFDLKVQQVEQVNQNQIVISRESKITVPIVNCFLIEPNLTQMTNVGSIP